MKTAVRNGLVRKLIGCALVSVRTWPSGSSVQRQLDDGFHRSDGKDSPLQGSLYSLSPPCRDRSRAATTANSFIPRGVRFPLSWNGGDNPVIAWRGASSCRHAHKRRIMSTVPAGVLLTLVRF